MTDHRQAIRDIYSVPVQFEIIEFPGKNIVVLVGDHTDYIILEPGTWELCGSWG